MSRGRRAALPAAGPRTGRGRLEEGGGLVVRCFSQDGLEVMDYDFSRLGVPGELRDALIRAFAVRTAPGAGRTSLQSIDKVYRAVVLFDRHLAALRWPPQKPSHLTAEHYDGFFESRRQHIKSASTELQEVRNLLLKMEGITDALAGRLAGPLPKRIQGEGKSSYSRDEFKRIAQSARADLRAAAARIRENREVLRRFRDGALEPGPDRDLAGRLELLDWVDRFADVPRMARTSGPKAGNVQRHRKVAKFGKVADIVSWLHLTVPELAAGAVLLGVMTGENPDVIIKAPAVHHRADGHTGAVGTAIVDLRKLRRGRHAYMSRALAQVPDWVSIPEEPEEISARDELHTPFGLYLLLHELTAGSRALTGSDRLLVGYSVTGGQGTGRGLRPISGNGLPISRVGRRWGLTADQPGGDGSPVALTLRLDLIRLTYIELHQKPVAHTEATAATYMLRNRGNIAEYQRVVADALAAEVAKARARGAVAVMSAQDVERAGADPAAVAAELGLDELTLKRMIAGELDTALAACTDNTAGRFNPGEPCRASFMQCLDCECARALPRHLPIQVLAHDRLLDKAEQMDRLQWASRFAGPHAQLADLLDQHDEAAVEDARRAATDADRLLVARFLNRELDLR